MSKPSMIDCRCGLALSTAEKRISWSSWFDIPVCSTYHAASSRMQSDSHTSINSWRTNPDWQALSYAKRCPIACTRSRARGVTCWANTSQRWFERPSPSVERYRERSWNSPLSCFASSVGGFSGSGTVGEAYNKGSDTLSHAIDDNLCENDRNLRQPAQRNDRQHGFGRLK